MYNLLTCYDQVHMRTIDDSATENNILPMGLISSYGDCSQTTHLPHFSYNLATSKKTTYSCTISSKETLPCEFLIIEWRIHFPKKRASAYFSVGRTIHTRFAIMFTSRFRNIYTYQNTMDRYVRTVNIRMLRENSTFHTFHETLQWHLENSKEIVCLVNTLHFTASKATMN